VAIAVQVQAASTIRVATSRFVLVVRDKEYTAIAQTHAASYATPGWSMSVLTTNILTSNAHHVAPSDEADNLPGMALMDMDLPRE
jgi:hypothetical protein